MAFEAQFEQMPRLAGQVLLVLLATLAFVLQVDVGFAQGFMVKPMRIEVPAVAGRVAEVPLEIRNTAGDGAKLVEVRLANLGQTDSGGWRLIEVDAESEIPSPYSSLPWTSVVNPSVSIAPLRPATINIRMNVPANARGVYYAAVIAETPFPPDANGIAVRVRFLIPLVIQIVGRPVRQQVALADAVMEFVDEPGLTPTTTAGLIVSNEGRTYSRVKGQLTVEIKLGDAWRPVTRVEVPEKAILPGVSLRLGDDLERRLPSGTYRLRGELSVDGRRVPPIIKEMEFAGDPTVDGLAFDTALLLEPASVTMDVVPGATRTTIVTVENPGTDPVRVSMVSTTPPGLAGVEMPGLRGIDISAEPWTEIRPAEFTIGPGRRQNVRVVSRVPREDVQYPHYYADLLLKGTYADGQSAGETRSTVHLANSAVPAKSDAMVEQLSIAEGGGPTEYIVQARFTNIGNVDVTPVGRVSLISSEGRFRQTVDLEGDAGIVLPLGKRNYSAALDLANLDPGYYAVRVVFALGNGHEISRQQVFQLENEEGTAADGSPTSIPVLTIDPEATDFPGGITITTEDVPPVTLGAETEGASDNG